MDVISVPTIMVCIFIAMVATSAAIAVVWMQNRNERAAGFWALAFLLGAGGSMMIAVHGSLVWYSIPAATALVTAAYVSFWVGYRLFAGLRAYAWSVIAAPALLLTAEAIWPQLHLNPNYTIAIQSIIIGVASLWSAAIIYNGRSNERLPTSTPLSAFLVIHAIFHLVHVSRAFLDPSPVIVGRLTAPWWKFFMMENFLNVVVVAIGCIILIKDRSEERHRRASETDALTGVANRRAFVQQTERLLPQAQENAILAILDIDHFKPINDRFGHQAGDAVLVEFARTIADQLPRGALFGRIGGEEFAIFLPDLDRDACAFLESLRHRVEGMKLSCSGTIVPLTISIGAARIDQAGRNFDHLVAAADCALYAAKEAGRNRLTLFSPSQRLKKVIEDDGTKRIGLAEKRVSRRSVRSHKSLKAS